MGFVNYDQTERTEGMLLKNDKSPCFHAKGFVFFSRSINDDLFL
jgi:hypothetical protein